MSNFTVSFPCGNKICGDCDCVGIEDCICRCEKCMPANNVVEEKKKLLEKMDREYLEELAGKMKYLSPFTSESIKSFLGKLDKEKGVSLRAALVGQEHCAGSISDILATLGKEESINRLSNPGAYFVDLFIPLALKRI